MTKLTIELVPSTSWYNNLRSHLPKEEWDVVRKACYKNAGYVCEICGGKGDKWPVECHEIWEYDDEKKIQKLCGTIALCPSCHMVKHIGLAQLQGKFRLAISHLMKVNSWEFDDAVLYVYKCFDVYSERSIYDWEVDISWLEKKEKT